MAHTRLQQLQSHLNQSEAWVLSNPNDIYYFTGFESLVPEEREAFLIVTPSKVYLIQASFSPSPNLDQLIILKGCSSQHLTNYLHRITADHALTTLYLDEDHLSVKEYKGLTAINSKLVPLDTTWIWNLRMVKDDQEIADSRQAAAIISTVITKTISFLKPGVTELEVKNYLVQQLWQAGSSAEAFPSIIAFGPHTALPHHQPGETRLEMEMPVLIDAGAQVHHYRSDMTRTIWFGSTPSDQFLQLEKIVHQAYQKAFAVAKSPSATAQQVDEAARNHIAQAGFGPQFNHTTGHGVGLDIHEPPSLNGSNSSPLKPGMLLTIEPGIYLEGSVGYRYENTVLLTTAGVTELTSG